jgi:Tol biopolymer transport system component
MALLVGVLASAPAASSRPQVPAENGWIAFVSFREDAGPAGFGVYRLEPIGGRVSRVGELRGRQPAWSPDGSLLAFVDLRWRLVVAKGNGQVVRVLTSGRYPAQNPSWSPDGSRIVFSQSGRWRFRGDLVVVTADGSSLRRITRTRHDDVEPSWSPSGSLIAFSSDRPVRLRDDYEIAVVRPDGSGLRNLTANEVFQDRTPAWSPDASRIAFVSGRDPGRFSDALWTMRSDGRDERLVQRTSDPSGIPSWSEWSPGWSPDGNWIVYVTNETFYPDNIFIVRPDGQDKTDLTPQTPSQDFDPAWQPLCSHMGTSGRDVLRGTLADDRLCGFPGPDVLVGGAGRDGLYGGEGNDTLQSRDGSFDVVGCGSGRDEVVADRVDLVGVDCERVSRR